MSRDAEIFYDSLFRIWEKMECADDAVAQSAWSFLEALAGRRVDDDLPAPFAHSVSLIHAEYEGLETDRKAACKKLVELLHKQDTIDASVLETLWTALFPEALHLNTDPKEQVAVLRESRKVKILRPVVDAVTEPAKQMIFTSNILLAPPDEGAGEYVDEELKTIIREAQNVRNEPQAYWYDHPVPLGIPIENDEVVYGLAGLSRALSYEKARGTAQPDDRLTVCLSVSVTHKGLRAWARPWLKKQLSRVDAHHFSGLDIYAFTEEDTAALVEMCIPWLENPEDIAILKATFGVDGEYGRHYSFLKALPALWSVLRDSTIKATFKIDLDQVFPQEELSAETGKSAFEHFMTELWGAQALDATGNRVELGMIAGALVNEKDISGGLFSPDIPWPTEHPKGEDLIFFKQRPMAVSTRAELMTRYEENHELDGVHTAIHRIHVTGGTNGIRLDALRRHRPFTPGFIGRAEDQGYILSVLEGDHKDAALRYIHAAGLIMRHDKEAFATAAVKEGKVGSYVGDLVRLFVFSAYAQCLPSGSHGIKNILDPFTGCFITPIPATLALLRLALHLLIDSSTLDHRKDTLALAGHRLAEWLHNGEGKKEEIAREYHQEKQGWKAFYDALDRMEMALNNAKVSQTATAFNRILSRCMISS